MTKAIRVATLALLLSVCAQAGVIQTDKEQPPPPPPPAATNTTQDGMETEALAEGIMQADLTTAATQAAMATLQSLLALF